MKRDHVSHDQLVRRTAAREGVSVRDARRIAGAYAGEVAKALAGGRAVVIAGVGTLTPPRARGGRTTFRASAAGRPTAAVPEAACDGRTDC